MHFTFAQYQESAQFLKHRLGNFQPKVAMVLGSGLGYLGDLVEHAIVVPYGEIPHFKHSTAPGHKGQLVFGTLEGRPVAVMQGRMHHYEGYSYEEVAYAVRVLRLLGCQTLFVTNAAGGVNGKQLELSFQDSQGDPESAVAAYGKLMDWGMQVLVGPTTTGASVTVAAKCYEERTFMLTPSASSVDVTAGKDNVFQVCFTDPNQGVGAADYMAENFADAKIAVIYRNDDAYSQGIRDAFVKEAGDKGLSIVYQGTFTLDTSSNFSVQLAAAQTAGADLVFLPIYYQPASVIFAQAKAMGYAPTFFGVDGMDGILDMPGFDTTLAEGLVLMTPFCATVESSKSFVDAYTAAYGTTPNQFAADAYDGVYIVKAALEKAGCTADMSNEEICDALVSAITSLKFTGLTGTDMSWNAEGQVSKAPTAYVVKDGQYVEG